MDSGEPLHVLFFPFLTRSHMIPMLETARLFSENGIKTSIVTTPANADPHQTSTSPPSLHLPPSHPPFLRPPSTSLPAAKNLTAVPVHLTTDFFSAAFNLRDPFSHLLSSLRPDAIISDAIYT
ncbi:UDP-glucose flavonoid 3-O-glucosyltransferase 7-like [Dioscorea cayenensis subsp. rotundata]|uniref:UDP-glucose flavonoid 3-O-glucosyltransferase 7-like n=1 Tax=Dioscorea cayennensis subsp. rotundata TaxID=55577 RepID=A0AB40CT59_DIOCR|nr:UDP-glucose flavonoid 3-O-glucosyltransferase 7-like [Dioscorea cayenensis subsp. rotundata]